MFKIKRPNRVAKAFALFLFITFGSGCSPEELNHPCDDVSCANGGTCVNGFCDCPDGFDGEMCLELVAPGAAWITGIEASNYPVFRDDLPWDNGAKQPDCWPDFAIRIIWPWSRPFANAVSRPMRSSFSAFLSPHAGNSSSAA